MNLAYHIGWLLDVWGKHGKSLCTSAPCAQRFIETNNLHEPSKQYIMRPVNSHNLSQKFFIVLFL